ncbi:MAG: ABC transporter permease [Chloroflexi bacterium]|nr:ABC transporter permease [Chloroflexota bacterium]
MTNYIIRRLLLNVLVLWFVATLVFVATHALPSDFAEKRVASSFSLTDQTEAIKFAREQLGTDKPLWYQYGKFMGELSRGDLGTSYETSKSTWSELGDRLPSTLELGSLIVLVSFSLSIPIGIISAVKQDTWIDYVLRAFSILGVAMPVFFAALLMALFVVRFSLFEIDVVGRPHFWTDPEAAAKLYVVPALAGGVSGGAGIMRILRSQMLEVMRQDYIRTARAKGLQDSKVWVRHAMKNAMLPVLTVMGLTLSGIVGGQIILENMFNIQGIGRFLFTSLNTRDFPPFQGTVLIIGFVIVTTNLAVDVVYAWLDPRIRYT